MQLHVDIHRILAVGVRHRVAAAQIDLGQRVGVGGVEGLAQQHHALGRLHERVRVVDLRADMRVDADQFQIVAMREDVLEHGQRRTVGHGLHRRGERPVGGVDVFGAQVVRVADVVAQRPGGGCDADVRAGRRDAVEVVEDSQYRRVGAGRQQRHAELLVLVRGGDELVAARVDAGGHAQHDAGAFAEPAGDGGDAGRLVRGVDHDLGEALFDGERDLLVRLVVAVQHQAASGGAGGERDAHLAHRAGVHQHARLGDDPDHFLGQERLAGEADMRGGVVERVGRGAHEPAGAGGHFVGVDEVQRRAELIEQARCGAPMEGQFAVGVERRGLGPDRGDCHIFSNSCYVAAVRRHWLVVSAYVPYMRLRRPRIGVRRTAHRDCYIRSGASTPSRSRPAAMTMRTASLSFRRAAARAGSGFLAMRSASRAASS